MEQRENGKKTMKMIISFLQLFMCETLAKRIVSIVLLAAGVSNKEINELTGLCDRSIRTLKKAIETGETDNLLKVGGGGRKSKLEDVETAIVDEINSNNYHSRQQIADMILEKHGIKVSLPAVGRLLKKRNQTLEMRVVTRKSGHCETT